MTLVQIKAKLEEDSEEARKMLILQERERYFAGSGKSYTWDEVKKVAINKEIPVNL